jgi:tellurite resistance protein
MSHRRLVMSDCGPCAAWIFVGGARQELRCISDVAIKCASQDTTVNFWIRSMSIQNSRQSSRMHAAELGEAHRSYLEDTLFDAVIVAGVVVALADGRADAAERSALVQFVEQNDRLLDFTPTDTSTAFDTYVRQFQIDGSLPETIFNPLRQVGNRAGTREIVDAAKHVALADGEVRSSEREAIQLIQSTLIPF